MLVKCIANRPTSLTDASVRQSFEKNVHLDRVELIVGHTYPVFGIVMRDGHPWFLVCEEPTDDHPKPHLAQFFEIIDGSIETGWWFCLESNIGGAALLPKPWAQDPAFLERLIDGELEALAYFRELKHRAGLR